MVASVKSADGPRPRRNQGNKKAPYLSDDVETCGAQYLLLIGGQPPLPAVREEGALPSRMIADVPC